MWGFRASKLAPCASALGLPNVWAEAASKLSPSFSLTWAGNLDALIASKSPICVHRLRPLALLWTKCSTATIELMDEKNRTTWPMLLADWALRARKHEPQVARKHEPKEIGRISFQWARKHEPQGLWLNELPKSYGQNEGALEAMSCFWAMQQASLAFEARYKEPQRL